MLTFTPIPGQGTSVTGEVALYDKLKELGEWMWDCLTCKLPCCDNDDYDNLNEEEEHQHAPSDEIGKTEQIPINTQIPPKKKPRTNPTDTEEVKIDVKDLDELSHEKKSTQFESLELSNLSKSKSKSSIKSFPKDTFFILSSSYSHILARIRNIKLETPAATLKTQRKWLKDDLKQHSEENDPNFAEFNEDDNLLVYEERYSLFSKYREGIRISKEDWLSAIPELVAQYLTKRIAKNCKTVLDAFCGAGSHTIQLARTCERVISFENSKDKIENCTKNAKIYEVVDKIEFNEKEFLDAENIKADVVFINYWNREVSEEISLWNDLNPSLRRVIDTAFSCADNFVMLLPSKSRLEELVEIVYEALEKNDDASKRSFIEIIHMKLDGKDCGIAVFYGEVSSVSVEEEAKALESVFKLDAEKKNEFKKLVESEGLWRAFKANVRENEKAKNESLTNVFS